jgi:hypothetical protein
MLSRRRFLVGSFAGLELAHQLLHPIPTLAKKLRLPGVPAGGPHILAEQYWSPAISADFIALIDNVHACLVDESGRLCVVDLTREEDDTGSAKALSELYGIGKRVIDFGIAQRRAFALVTQSAADTNEPQFAFNIINLGNLEAPSVVSRTILAKYLDVSCFAVNQDTVCVGGIASTGENLVSVYTIGRGKNAELVQLSALRVDAPIKALDLQERVLIVLQGPEGAKLSIVSLANPRTPEVKKTLSLDGTYALMARLKDVVLVGGSADNACSVQFITLGTKTQNIAAPIKLPSVMQLLSIAGQRDLFLVLGETPSGNKMLASYRMDKNQNFAESTPVLLRREKEPSGSGGRLAIGNKAVFIASGWGGVQMLSMTTEGWSPTRKYVITRLPTSGLAIWGNYVVLAGADLKLYDISHPDKPSLVSSTALTSGVRAVTGAGSFVLCLSKDALTLRKIEKLDEIAASLTVAGQQICFDQIQQKAYLLKEEKDKSTATQLKVYSNSIVAKASFDLKPGVSRAYANDGELIAGGLHDLALYKVDDQLEPVGDIHLENLALRDFVLGKDFIFATVVDQDSQGFLLVLTKDKGQLQPVSSTKIPHDGVALSILNETIATVGRTTQGKNLVSLIDISSTETPKVIKSLPAPESASTVTIKDKLAIIAGRGLEIVSLS